MHSSDDHTVGARPVQVFVLGTGRSGSQTMAEVLTSVRGCRVVHGVKPLLLAESGDFVSGRGNTGRLREVLAKTRSAAAIGGMRLSGESHNRLSFVIELLYDVFPRARYVWLFRDGRSVVASLHHRYWYHRREAALRSPAVAEWVRTRIQGDEVGEMSSNEWEKLDSFARCCWYWSFTNRHIRNEIRRLGLEAYHCRLERLRDELPDLLTFLGLADVQAPEIRRANSSQGMAPLPWSHWSARQLDTFEQFAGSVMDELYSGWRDQLARTKTTKFFGCLDRGLRAVLETTRSTRQRLGLTKAALLDRR